MAKKTDLVEIRLDRRQTFYAVVGSLLVVSVVFVVGLILGQRMQIPQPGVEVEPLLAAHSTTSANPASTEEEPVPRPDDFTFYEELTAGSPGRPSVQLLPAADATASAEASRAAVEATNPTQADGENERIARVDPQPVAGDPTSRETAGTGSDGRIGSTDDRPAPPDGSTEVTAGRTSRPGAEGGGQEQVANLNPRSSAASSGQTRNLQRRTVRRVSSEASLQGPEEFGYFTVEVGVYTSFDRASEVRQQLQRAGHEAIVSIIGDDPSARRYRVQVGSFTRRSDAQSTAREVSGMGLDARVIQEG